MPPRRAPRCFILITFLCLWGKVSKTKTNQTRLCWNPPDTVGNVPSHRRMAPLKSAYFRSRRRWKWRRRTSVVAVWLFIVDDWLFIVGDWLFAVDDWCFASPGILFFLVSRSCWRSYGPFRMVSKYWQRNKEMLLVTTTPKANIDKYQQKSLYTHSPGNSPPVWRLQKCLKYVQIHPKYIYKKWQKRANKECKNEQIYTQITAKTRYICSQSHKKSSDVQHSPRLNPHSNPIA